MYEETMVREVHDRLETIRHDADMLRLAGTAPAAQAAPFERARRGAAELLRKIARAVDPDGTASVYPVRSAR